MPRPPRRAADDPAEAPEETAPPGVPEDEQPAPDEQDAVDSPTQLAVDERTLALEPQESTDLAINGSADSLPLALPPGPLVLPDPGLYAILGLDPSASDAEIQTTYRRQAARVHGGGANAVATLRQLNVAYEVLGNRVRRVDYDRQRLSQVGVPTDSSTPVRPGVKTAGRLTRRRRPRYIVQPRYAGLADVFVVLTVVGLAVLAGALIIPRLSVNLSALNVLQNVLPLANTQRRAADASATPVPATAVPTATLPPGVAARFAGTTVGVSNPNPPQNSSETVSLKLRRDGQPAANVDVWANVQYRTTEERWPATGSIKTDATGAASITFNVGSATRDYAVPVRVFAQADDQQLSWSTTFTPH